MGQTELDKHQLAGVDNRGRGFSRPVEFEQAGKGYCAVLRYEAIRVTTESYSTQDEALVALIESLHDQGYRQLKTQMNFHDGVYLGSKELWVEYPDPLQAEPEQSGFFDKLKNWFTLRSTNG